MCPHDASETQLVKMQKFVEERSLEFLDEEGEERKTEIPHENLSTEEKRERLASKLLKDKPNTMAELQNSGFGRYKRPNDSSLSELLKDYETGIYCCALNLTVYRQKETEN